MQALGSTTDSGPGPSLLRACIRGDMSLVQRIIKRRRSITAMLSVHGNDGCTPILLACKHGHMGLIKVLLRNGGKIDDRDRDPKRQGTPLHYAAWGGHLDIVQYLLKQGAQLDEVDIVGNTALLYAVYGGHRHIVEDLLKRGRSLHERNSKNHTVLLQASCGGHLDLVVWMLDEGFELDETDHDGNTALLFAAWGGHLELIHFLIEKGASLHEQNNNGHSVLLSAANGGRINVVEWLMDQGFSLEETNNNGDTALLLAAYGGHRPLVEWLLERGAELDDRNGCGFTPLLSAANGGQLEMAAWLLKNGSSMDEADNDGYTSLILGACGGNIELVQFFLENGAELSERNHNGDTALLLAAYCGHHDLVEWLVDRGSSLSERNNTGMGVLISAANGGNIDVVQLLLKRIAQAQAVAKAAGDVAADDCGDGLEHTDEGGYTPFLLAAQRGHLAVVQLLAAYGANIQARTTRHDNNAIALATDFPDVQAYIQETWDWSPLEVAIDARMVDRIHGLIQMGVDVAQYPNALEIASNTSKYTSALPPCKETVKLIGSASLSWSPTRHDLFSNGFKRCVLVTLSVERALLLDANRDDTRPILPSEIWLLIISHFQRAWFQERTSDKLQVGWCEPTSEKVRRKWRSRQLTKSESSDEAVESEDEAVAVDEDEDRVEDVLGSESFEDEVAVAKRRARNSTSENSAASKTTPLLPSSSSSASASSVKPGKHAAMVGLYEVSDDEGDGEAPAADPMELNEGAYRVSWI